MFLATEKGNLDQIETLVNAGCDVNMQTCDDKETPVMIATRYGNDEVVKKLADLGAKMDILNKEQETALVLSILSGRPNMIEMFPNHDKNHVAEGRLFSAIIDGDLDEVKKLVDKEKVNVNSRANGFTTALCFAVELRELQIVSFLLDKGADANAASTFPKTMNETALIKAVENYDADCVEALLNKGADPNKESDNTGNALIHALNKTTVSEKIVKQLLAKKADVSSVKKKDNERALTMACRTGNDAIVKEMLVKGANDVDEAAMTVAEKRGFFEIVQLLMDVENSSNRNMSKATGLI